MNPILEGVTPANPQKELPKVTEPQVEPDTKQDDDIADPLAKTTEPVKSNRERAEEREAAEAAKKAEEEKKAAEGAKGDQDDVKKETQDDAHESWGDVAESGDETVDSVLDLMKESGVDVDTAKALLWEPIRDGDLSKIDRDALVEKVGKARATLIMTGAKAVVEENQRAVKAATDTVNAAAGGSENWSKVVEWAKKGGISEGDLGEYADMINKGGKAAKFAAAEIVAAYNADAKNTALDAGKKTLSGDSAPKTPAVKGISSAQYGDALVAAERKFGASSPKFAAARQALKAQRAAGRKQGL